MVESQTFPQLELELRRGVVVLATLSQLGSPRYGYELRQALAERGLSIEEGTLYPLMRRLESQGLLSSEWRTDGAPRRYYVLSPAGRRLLKQLTATWLTLNQSMERLLAEGGRSAR
jgi:DNA-binding PadR family transcriptional regulator